MLYGNTVKTLEDFDSRNKEFEALLRGEKKGDKAFELMYHFLLWVRENFPEQKYIPWRVMDLMEDHNMYEVAYGTTRPGICGQWGEFEVTFEFTPTDSGEEAFIEVTLQTWTLEEDDKGRALSKLELYNSPVMTPEDIQNLNPDLYESGQVPDTWKSFEVRKFRKKPVVVEATQWFKNGDHPCDGNPDSEGKVVRYFRHPGVSGDLVCPLCERAMHDHGFIDTLEGGHTVCPGDWIITGVKGERYPCKPDIFEQTYEEVTEG